MRENCAADATCHIYIHTRICQQTRFVVFAKTNNLVCEEFAIYDFGGSATRIVRHVCRVSRAASGEWRVANSERTANEIIRNIVKTIIFYFYRRNMTLFKRIVNFIVDRSWLIKGKSYLRASGLTRIPLNKIDWKVAEVIAEKSRRSSDHI